MDPWISSEMRECNNHPKRQSGGEREGKNEYGEGKERYILGRSPVRS